MGQVIGKGVFKKGWHSESEAISSATTSSGPFGVRVGQLRISYSCFLWHFFAAADIYL